MFTNTIADQMAKVDSVEKMETFLSLVNMPTIENFYADAREAFAALQAFRAAREKSRISASEAFASLETEMAALKAEANEY